MLFRSAFFLSTALAVPAAVSFNRDIRPILSNNCIQCHGPDEAERKGGPRGSGGLRLDTAEGIVMDLGEGRKAVVPGKAEASELFARITTHDADELMPPGKSGKRLKESEVKLLTDWINEGASFAKHWSYEKPQRPVVPRPGHPVDAFVFERLEKEGLKPQPEADRSMLIRRVALDLTGLPPGPEEVEAFVKDASPDAYEKLVDRVLGSPAYGEHQAKQWLDLARYADSAGYADDPSRTIWGYRDYVIRAFNENRPFDQFTIEQIAGDLLPIPTEDQLIATAFHRNTMTNSEGGTNDEEFRSAAIVDRVNTTIAVWMGSSMACAQCHTHKYDPITHHEYFQLYAFLNSTEDADRRNEEPLHPFFSTEQKAQRKKLEAEAAAVQAKVDAPGVEVLASADKWSREFPPQLVWEALKPSALKSQAELEMKAGEDGAVTVPATAAKDVYTIELPVEKAQSLTALRLEALAAHSLPGKGPGHGSGNFVVTSVRAEVAAPQNDPGPAARFVRIELPGKAKLLHMAEVQVFSGGINIAPKGLASQKSTKGDAVASRANDGNTDGEYVKGSVSHTGESDNPWWEVDLKSAQPIERIVVWNRADVSERLAGFKVVALDEKRAPVWERADNLAAAESSFALSGARSVIFSDAVADYEQEGFFAESVIAPPSQQKPRKKTPRDQRQGWAVGGAAGQDHWLMLLPTAPVALAAGGKLVVTIEMQSPHVNHTLGRFRFSMTEGDCAAELLDLPEEIAQTRAISAGQRSAQQVKALIDFYIREHAPELEPLRKQLAELKSKLDTMPTATVPVMRDLPENQRRATQVHLRGNWQSLGDKVSEGVPAAWHPLPPGAPKNRLTLARWLVSEDNPLTARVVANRFWETLFGVGLVRTSEEFGAQGELPSHPELLDWLAVEFMSRKWDVKSFLKLLVTSASYRQSSRVKPGMAERDPENRLLARGPRLRLSAEMVRDQALAVSGLLSSKMYGPSVRPQRPNMGLSAAFGGGLDWQTSGGEDRFRRALYTEWRRTSPYPSMTTFDAPNREVCTLRRNRTNTPLQALVTLNDPVYVEAAQALARRVSLPPAPPEIVIRRAMTLALSRPPAEKETQRLRQLFEEALTEFCADAKKAAEMATNPIGPVPADADAATLAAWTTVANVILNLDEALMKK